MEQVAEALMAIKFANPDQNGWSFNYDTLKEIAHHASDEDCSMEQVESILLRIIEIYGKKTPVIEWHSRTGETLFDGTKRYSWTHDVTGEKFRSMYFLENKCPEYALKWADGTFGGYVFEAGDKKFKTTEGVRGMGYKAVIAFDKLGNGAVFFG